MHEASLAEPGAMAAIMELDQDRLRRSAGFAEWKLPTSIAPNKLLLLVRMNP